MHMNVRLLLPVKEFPRRYVRDFNFEISLLRSIMGVEIETSMLTSGSARQTIYGHTLKGNGGADLHR